MADTRAYEELKFTSSYLNAFRSLCTGMFVVRVPGPYPCNLLTMKTTQLTLPGLRQPAPRLALNFIRRYKWAFRPEYARLSPQVAVPDLTAFASASEDVLKNEQEPLRIHFERARDGLAGLNVSTVGVAGPWHEDRLQVTNPSTFTFFFLQTELFFSTRGCSISLFRCGRTCARCA